MIYTYVINGDTLINNTNYKKMLYSYRRPEMDYDKYWCMYFCRYENGKYLFYLPEYKERHEKCYIGDDYVFCDESLTTGDIFVDKYNKIGSINDTIFYDSADRIRKCWKLQPHGSISARYQKALNYCKTLIQKGYDIFGAKFNPIIDFMPKEEYKPVTNFSPSYLTGSLALLR